MELKIFVDRLKDGQEEKISAEIPSDFLAIDESELHLTSPVFIKGNAYLASDHLILKLDVKTKISIPCSVCNQPTEVSIHLPDFYHTEPIQDISGSVLDFTDLVREDILLLVPQFVECNQGKCPERGEIKKYLKPTENGQSHTAKEHVHFPFSNL
ncbi:MAG: hypothetical protein EBZ47_00150 [Chlamydiae bacterium]|nr:hypothetical protein [Chlamydiota bacterium]